MPTSSLAYAKRLLSNADLAFIVDGPSRVDDLRDLRQSLAIDESRRAEVLGDDQLFQRVLAMDDALVRISPRLFFEVLLRRAIHDITRAVHVLERAGRDRVPLFVGEREVQAISQPVVIDYLAEMLASFTKINSHTARVRVRRGVWRKSRYSDLDVPSLLRLASEVDETRRMAVLQRAGDASLLILGVFSDFAASAIRYPGTGTLRRRRGRLTTEEYENVAGQVYKLVADDPATDSSNVEPLRVLSEHVIDAKRPLVYLAENYLRLHQGDLFGMGA